MAEATGTAPAMAKPRYVATSVADALSKLQSPDEAKTPHCTLVVDGGAATDKDLSFTVSKEQFLSLLTSSQSGKSLGVTCDITGAFDFQGPDGKVLTLDVRNNGFRTTVNILKG